MQDLKSEPKASNLQGIVILRKRVIRILDKSYNNAHTEHQLAHDQISRHSFVTRSVYGRVFTMPIVLLNIIEGVLFTDFVERLNKGDRCFHE